MGQLSRKIELKNWDRKRIRKGAAYSQLLSSSGKIAVRVSGKHAILKAGEDLLIPQGITRYEVIAAYGPATVIIT